MFCLELGTPHLWNELIMRQSYSSGFSSRHALSRAWDSPVMECINHFTKLFLWFLFRYALFRAWESEVSMFRFDDLFIRFNVLSSRNTKFKKTENPRCTRSKFCIIAFDKFNQNRKPCITIIPWKNI